MRDQNFLAAREAPSLLRTTNSKSVHQLGKMTLNCHWSKSQVITLLETNTWSTSVECIASLMMKSVQCDSRLGLRSRGSLATRCMRLLDAFKWPSRMEALALSNSLNRPNPMEQMKVFSALLSYLQRLWCPFCLFERHSNNNKCEIL